MKFIECIHIILIAYGMVIIIGKSSWIKLGRINFNPNTNSQYYRLENDTSNLQKYFKIQQIYRHFRSKWLIISP